LNFEITRGDISGLEVKLHRGTVITGVIALESGADPALLSQISRFSLSATSVASSEGVPDLPSINVNPDASFRISGLRPGKVRFYLRGPNGLQLSRVERDGVEQPQGMIEVAAGEQITGVRLLAAAGTGVIRGEVKITGEALPEGAQLLVSAARLGAGGTGSTEPSGNATATDARGRLLMEKLPPGEYELSVSLYLMPPPGVASLPPRSLGKQTVAVANGTEAKITLTFELSKDKEPQP
jgi:hypothetical protein